jgi:thiol-disulfide isomerase/thioredoxin
MPLFAIAALLAVPGVAQDKEKKTDKPVEVTQKKEPYKLGATVDENIVLKDIDGKELKLKDLRGKVVFIHFWSKDCPYEENADPKVQALEKGWKGKDVAILAIDSNSSEIGATPPKDAKGYDAIREHLKTKNMSFPVYADHGNKIADMFNAQHTPHCFVIDKKGVLVYMGGLDDDPKNEKGANAKQYVRDAVEEVLAGKEVTTKESKPYGCGIKRVGT